MANDYGLKTTFYETDNKELIALFTPRACHQSYPRITHGGITAAILDEAIGRAIMIHSDSATFGVTIELTITYKKPVPYDCRLKALCRITSNRGRIFEGTGELYLPDGTIAATARGRYLKRTLGQITDESFTDEQWFAVDDHPEEIDI
ncbi:MAG: PaaI family thioesterase [Desulfofustis sp. PB-SRB1]|nr:PaaI family thioesterase [Desulfofustis sp. PB-SRB1]MBM1003086.1 PaaI family thioesterase [Desulfofustis sp. PB-SRB1]